MSRQASLQSTVICTRITARQNNPIMMYINQPLSDYGTDTDDMSERPLRFSLEECLNNQLLQSANTRCGNGNIRSNTWLLSGISLPLSHSYFFPLLQKNILNVSGEPKTKLVQYVQYNICTVFVSWPVSLFSINKIKQC